MSFKEYLKQRLQVEQDIEDGKIKVNEIYAGTLEKDTVNDFIVWLQEQGIKEINDGNVSELFADDFNLVDSVADYWDEFVNELKNAGIKVCLNYDN